MYITHFPQVESILQNIRAAFEESLPATEWMDANTRVLAMNKAQAIVQKIGYPDFIMDPATLDKYYQKVWHVRMYKGHCGGV